MAAADRMPTKARPRPAELPDFERPPVTEVVLGIQFAALTKLRSVHIGLLWSEFRASYPHVSEQVPLPPAFEIFGAAPTAMPPMLQFQALLAPPMARFWFETPDRAELVQVQQDRMLHNWRKRQTEQEYPHYEALRERFEAEISTLASFLQTQELGNLRVNQCEVTYVNTIELPGESAPHRHLNRVTPLWSGRWDADAASELEDATIQSRYILRDGGKPYGRMHVVFSPAFSNGNQVIRLEITTRGKPADEFDRVGVSTARRRTKVGRTDVRGSDHTDHARSVGEDKKCLV